MQENVQQKRQFWKTQKKIASFPYQAAPTSLQWIRTTKWICHGTSKITFKTGSFDMEPLKKHAKLEVPTWNLRKTWGFGMEPPKKHAKLEVPTWNLRKNLQNWRFWNGCRWEIDIKVCLMSSSEWSDVHTTTALLCSHSSNQQNFTLAEKMNECVTCLCYGCVHAKDSRVMHNLCNMHALDQVRFCISRFCWWSGNHGAIRERGRFGSIRMVWIWNTDVSPG